MKNITWIGCFVWLTGISWLQGISRSDFYSLWGTYTIVFAAFVWIAFSKHAINLHFGLVLGLLGRLISLFFEPLLSDDYFRFIWDGMLIHEGVNPMAYTPEFLMQHPEIIRVNETLFGLLNSQKYYSVYPPVAQWIFGLSYKINGLDIPGHILFYKILLIAADALIVWFLYQLVNRTNLSPQRILWYVLNPLVIIEYAGNLHMDGLMIASLLGAVVLSNKKTMLWSGFLMSFSILTKLVPLLLIPFMPRHLYWKKITFFSVLSVSLSILVFWISFGQNTGWLDSVHLWFSSFEFNASLYYIARTMGYWFAGYNTITKTGPFLALITISGIGLYWWRYMRSTKSGWPSAMLFVLTLYFLMSTTIHPWYLGSMLALSVMSKYLFPMVWTYLAFLSYSHYTNGQFAENYLLITTEYLLLIIWMFWEWRLRKKTHKPAQDASASVSS